MMSCNISTKSKLFVLDFFLGSGILKVVFLSLSFLYPGLKVLHLLLLVGMDHLFSLWGFDFFLQISLT